MIDVIATLEQQLHETQAGWSMGSFGAIAEFHQDPGEAATSGFLWRVTDRGGIRLIPHPDLRPLAYETLSPKPHRWSQSVALCLPAEAAALPRRQALTELGPDRDALRDGDRDGLLFDMGLDQPQVQFCIRTSDPALITTLRAAAGRSLMEPGNPAMGAILAAHPHRVALTALGRVEVFQKIGGPETGGRSPEGPHTHVLPKLLASGRTHSANTPIPDGLIPCAALHPSNPVIGPLGEDRAYDDALFAAFDQMLAAWGPDGYRATKAEAWDLIAAGHPPQAMAAPDRRLGRVALRNAIRQARRQGGGNAILDAWATAFDPQSGDMADVEADHE